MDANLYWKAVPLLVRGERGEERLAPKTVRLIAGQARGSKVRANCRRRCCRRAAPQPSASLPPPPPLERFAPPLTHASDSSVHHLLHHLLTTSTLHPSGAAHLHQR